MMWNCFRDAGTTVHTMGLVVDGGCLREVSCRGQLLVQRDVTLASSECNISLTLWGKVATDFSSEKKVIVVSRAKVKVYQGVRNLSLPTSGSYEVEPRGVRGVEELILWGRKAGGVTETSITQEVRSLAFPAPTSSSHSCFCSFPSHLLTRTKQWQCWRPDRSRMYQGWRRSR